MGCFVQPLDLVKTRMQVSKGVGGAKPSTFSVISSVVKNEGITTLYTGLSAGLLRQATYTTTRLGIYTWLFETFSTDGTPPSFFMKAALGMTAGGAGAFVGTPAEVALIGMTSDGSLPVEKRRNYSSVFNALARIYKEEGLTTLWRGATPTIARAMVVNAAQLASYSQAKQAILGTGYIQDGIFCHFVASMISGLVTTIASMPVDIAKTRLQSMKSVEGVHAFLLPAGPSHSPHLHIPRTGKHRLQAPRPRYQGRQWRTVRSPRDLCTRHVLHPPLTRHWHLLEVDLLCR